MKYDTVVGLEVHIQMNTSTKAFCSDANTFGQDPNTHVSAISLAHPGTLPVANIYHIEKAIQLGLALGSRINNKHFFDRKHYFYPDLPKGYQITQDQQPICVGGSLEISASGAKRKVQIHHIHMEEDAGKSIHDLSDDESLIDLNRAGTPLLELVTEPDLYSGEEVFQFIAELQKLLRYINVSDADMEKGSLRCDCNVSVKPAGETILGERCEVKNLNSKRFAREAVIYEARRQIELIENGKTFSKQTLHYDPVAGKTFLLREKEGVADYRYFPDPDLPPLTIDEAYIETLKSQMPSLPWEVREILSEKYGLSADYANQISADPSIYEFYLSLTSNQSLFKSGANLLVNQILPTLDEDQRISDFKVPVEICVQYLSMVHSGQVNVSQAHQKLWPLLLQNPSINIESKAKELGLLIDTDHREINKLVEGVILKYPDQVKQYKKGKKALIGFFIGAIMKQSKGGIDPQQLKKSLIEILDKTQ